MYVEHLIAHLQRFLRGTVPTGALLDYHRARPTVSLGRIIGPDLGCHPSDPALLRLLATTGARVPLGTRGAIHVLPDGRTGLALGNGRGVIESIGDRLVIVTTPEPDRYATAWKLPTLTYGGLI